MIALNKAILAHAKHPSKKKLKRINRQFLKEIHRMIEQEFRNDLDRIFFIQENQE